MCSFQDSLSNRFILCKQFAGINFFFTEVRQMQTESSRGGQTLRTDAITVKPLRLLFQEGVSEVERLILVCSKIP